MRLSGKSKLLKKTPVGAASSREMNYPAAELRSIKMNFYLLNPDAEHRGILLIKKNNIT